MASTSVYAALGLLLVVLLFRIFRVGKRPHGLPPGPRTIPLLGNVHMFPRENAYLQFTAWAREYGGIYSLMMGSQPTIVISNARIAKDLIDKKSGSASDRPPTHMVNVVTDGKYLTFARYSPDWRRARSMLQKMLTKEACAQHLPILQAEATQLMYDFLADPERFFEHTARYSYSLATSVLSGTRAPRSTSPLLTAFSSMIQKWSYILEPGAQPPVDLLPILKYVPARWAPWKGLCSEIRAKQFELYEGLVSLCESRMKQNMRNGCLLESVLDDKKLGTDRTLIRGTIGAFLEGATDTTSLFLRSLILMLVAFPEAQAKAHKEIDAVIGSERTPVVSDFADLPYIQAIVKEVLRIRPAVPTGVPHYTTQEEIIDGFVIPKGSSVFVNQYGILHDPEDYDNPDTFDPDRFLRSEFGTKPDADNAGRGNDTHFGGGRRICVGMNLANMSMMATTMNFLWAFDFKEAIDPVSKRRIPVDINNYSEGIATAPNPFKCEIRVRSPLHASIIKQEFRSARSVFERFEHDLSPDDASYVRNLVGNSAFSQTSSHSVGSRYGAIQRLFGKLLPGVVLAAVFLYIRGGLRWQTLSDIRGPKSDSWLFGHQILFNRQIDVGQLDFAWNREFGGAWKIDGCFGRNILMVADPAAIHHILHTQGYGYPKTRESKAFTGLAFGRGVSWAGGETHVRHRKLLNPAFTAQPLRTFYPVFRRVAAQLTQQWRDTLQEGELSTTQTIDVSRGLVNTTLDIIGEAVFDYHFGALDGLGKENEFSKVFHNLFADSNLFPSPGAILFGASWAYVPERILNYVEYLPFRQFVRFRQFLKVGKGLGKDLIENEAASSGLKKGRDILSILVEANKSGNADDRLDEDEVLSQVTTLLFAGHETTACTLTWLVYELAHHPEHQTRVREEVNAKRSKITSNGQKDFTATDLENLPFTNAVIKEALRYHPISPWVTRESIIDDVVPLSEPIMSTSGKMISEVKVTPGQPVLVSTCAYNRLKSVWGEDADQWNPSRHLDTTLKERQVPIGLYSNLLTFSGGPSGCIGWKFALTEMQSTVVELIENFEFTPPPTKDNIEMLRVPVGAIMAPMIKGRFDERTQMPLGVSFLR
ncbi:hypothetical protein EW146_g3349 [Bondarzewia mesenterica]|uniref:Cytochrome P450 n=1 Tax=Bondarzewia mesenterica TaxID=1095465 RepID=A0A4S4LXS7_9AGAM|nr:hypothetical protein EW146_g3349 [Bondarzewia mesenterica]